MPASENKPPYRVPAMSEIEAAPDNGLRIVSTFSGCGGSCLGFRMAGFRTLWASEFVEAAREVYALNHPGVPVDGRDIRDVRPKDVLKAAKAKAGEIDVLEGSPPCSVFSTAGRRAAKWGEQSGYSDDKVQRVDDLFFEFVRLLKGIRPKTFVAENVSGLVKGVAKGYFKAILAALREAGYEVEARLLDAQWLGVPQARQRIIFQGVREDLAARGLRPAWPAPMAFRYTVRDACPWIVKAVHDTKGNYGSRVVTHRPCPTITVGVNSLNAVYYQVQGPEVTEEELSFITLENTAIGREWGKLKPGEQSERYFSLVKAHPNRPCPTVTQTAGTRGAAGVVHPFEPRKFTELELKRLSGFPDDFLLSGTFRQRWERIARAVPPLMMRAVAECVRDGPLKEFKR